MKRRLRYDTRGRTKAKGAKDIRAVKSFQVGCIAVDTAFQWSEEDFNKVIGKECSHKDIMWVYAIQL
ncbi:MAG: hypothetical protein KA519_03180 [Bacteroides sp.]|nr:hypothetical protein [Bacteroides sp.]MBP6067067.1 hypothetical protein [Bacteroides sp.]